MTTVRHANGFDTKGPLSESCSASYGSASSFGTLPPRGGRSTRARVPAVSPRSSVRPGRSDRVALDIGREMLVQLVDRWPSDIGAPDAPDLVLGDGVRPPFGERSFDLVAALGNLLGFAGAESDRLLESLTALLAGGGTLLLEIAPGPGERSRYLRRLPPRSVARLMRAPPRAVATRVEREGFIEETRRKAEPGDFRRASASKRFRSDSSARGFTSRRSSLSPRRSAPTPHEPQRSLATRRRGPTCWRSRSSSVDPPTGGPPVRRSWSRRSDPRYRNPPARLGPPRSEG